MHLTTEPATIYPVSAPKNEYEAKVYGYYLDKHVAKSNCPGLGWYGAPGTVGNPIEVYRLVGSAGHTVGYVSKDFTYGYCVNEDVSSVAEREKEQRRDRYGVLSRMFPADLETLDLAEELEKLKKEFDV